MSEKIAVEYNPINRQKVDKVILCNENDQDYQKFLDFCMKKGKESKEKKKKERIRFYNQNKKVLDQFHKFFVKYYHNHETVEHYCLFCSHSGKDKYRPDDSTAMCCWHDYKMGKARTPTKIQAYDITPCGDNFIYKWSTSDHLTKSLLFAWEQLTNEKYIFDKYNVFRKKKLIAILQDVFGEKIESLKIGKDAIHYEQDVINLLEENGLPPLDNILKFYYSQETFPRFKIMDFYTIIYRIHFILEVKHDYSGSSKSPSLQVQDYKFLLGKTVFNEKIQPIIICPKIITYNLNQNDEVEEYEVPEGTLFFGTPYHTPEGFLNSYEEYIL